MYVYRNILVHVRNQRSANAAVHFVFLHVIAQTARFSENIYWRRNVCFDFLYNFGLQHFSFLE